MLGSVPIELLVPVSHRPASVRWAPHILARIVRLSRGCARSDRYAEMVAGLLMA